MLNVFISYAHQDAPLLEELRKHLAPLRRQKLINDWSDRKIMPGERWEPSIWNEFENANLILLLISADFLASYYCYEREFAEALAREKAKTARVVPIIVRDCMWEVTPLKDLQKVPEQPITLQPDRDAAWTGVVKDILKVVQELSTRQAPRVQSGEDDFEGDALVSLCNRQDQEQELWTRFLAAPVGAPQIYFLSGSEDAQHQRFIDRVLHRTLPDMLGQPAESLRDIVKPVSAPWVETPPSGREFPYLLTKTVREIDLALEPDAAKIKAHRKLAGRIVVIKHNLFARYWNPKMAGLLESYIDFWGKAADDRDRPLFLIFFMLTHSAEGQIDAIEDEVTALSERLDGKPCTVALLPRMGGIEREHVYNWLEHNMPRSRRGRGEALLDRLFGANPCLPMGQVAKQLEEFIG